MRARAATALGRLGDPAALPALDERRRDRSGLVRRRATEAAAALRRRARTAPPALIESRRPIYVTLKSASDESSGRAGLAARRTRASRMRSLMQRHLESSKGVTVVASDSASMADPYAIDLTMRRLSRVERGPHVEVECEIRVAVSTREGKMLSVLTGGAKVQVPRDTFRDEFMPRLRREALEGAVRSVHRDLLAFLVKLP